MKEASHKKYFDKFIETESRMVVAGGWGVGGGGLLFNGCRVSVLQDEEFWRWMGVMAAQQSELT